MNKSDFVSQEYELNSLYLNYISIKASQKPNGHINILGLALVKLNMKLF